MQGGVDGGGGRRMGICVWCADNDIGDAGAKHVSAMLEKNTTLLKLDLGGKHDEHGACRAGQRGEGQGGSGEMELLSGGLCEGSESARGST